MRTAHSTIGSHDVHRHTAALLQLHLGLRDFGRTCPALTLLHLLCAAAARLTSLFAACRALRGPAPETARRALFATLPDYAELQRRVNRALVGDLPKPLRRRPCRLAIDLHLVPYYGQPHADPKEVYRSQAKAGTHNFHAYASAYVVLHGRRYTVALLPVERGQAMKDVVQRLLLLARKARVRPRLLLLDRGFYSIDVIRYLQAARVPFLLPAVARGRRPRAGQPVTGIRALQQCKRGCWTEHTLRDGSRTATTPICVYCGQGRGRRKRRGRKAWVYAYWGFRPASGCWVAETYRLRFGIETSYRQLREALLKTCSRDVRVRLLRVAVALVLRNVWVWLHWQVLSSPRRGQRRLRPERLRFKTMLLWLLHVAQTALGVRDEIPTERRLPQELQAAPTASVF